MQKTKKKTIEIDLGLIQPTQREAVNHRKDSNLKYNTDERKWIANKTFKQ